MAAGEFEQANKGILDRMIATGITKVQAQNAMYYAYQRGHSAGEHEVCLMAFNLLLEVFEAKG